MPTSLVKHYFWLFLWGCVWKRLAFDSIAGVNPPSSVWADFVPSVGGPSGTKKQRKRKFWFSLFELGYSCSAPWGSWFWGFWPPTKINTIGSSGSQAFGLHWVSTGYPGSPGCRQQTVELVGLHNHESFSTISRAVPPSPSHPSSLHSPLSLPPHICFS